MLILLTFFDFVELYQLAIKQFQIPGDKGFPLGGKKNSNQLSFTQQQQQ
jgi:hypothetical protein